MTFECWTGGCVPYYWQCDGIVDCDDATDELGCDDGEEPNCDSWEWVCDNGQCIADNYYCDGLVDCNDGSDEAEFGCLDTGCEPDEFTCDDGQCIWEWFDCDGIVDCICSSSVCGGGRRG